MDGVCSNVVGVAHFSSLDLDVHFLKTPFFALFFFPRIVFKTIELCSPLGLK